MTDKSELRAAMRATRKQLAALDPRAAFRVAGHADDLPGEVIHAVYWPIGSESLDPIPLATRLAGEGHDLCLPVVVTLDEPMIFRRWYEAMREPDAAGVPAPLPLAEAVVPELILTPLLAYDATGRLGQGGGHYDRTFAALPDATRIGLAYAGQRVDRLTLEPHDVRLHGVLTEVGYTPARGLSGRED